MHKYIFIILLPIIQINFSYSKDTVWEKVDSVYIYMDGDTSPVSYWYWAIDCANDSDCIAIGDLNSRYPWNRVTTDGGKTWATTLRDTARFEYKDGNKKTIYQPSKMVDISYPDTNLCIAVGDSGYYWRSTDRCKSWNRSQIKFDNPPNQYTRYHIDLYDTIQGAIISPSELFLTDDGGLTWYKPKFNISESSIPISFNDIKVPITNYIICSVSNWILKDYFLISKDFGLNWTTLTFDTLDGRFHRLFFFDKNKGWAACSRQLVPNSSLYYDVIMKTLDGGKTWVTKLDTLLPPSSGLQNIYFSDSLNGYALCYYIGLWRTTDGGEFWWRDSTFNRDVKQFVTDIAVLSNNEVLVVTEGNYIYKSSTDGTSVPENFELSNDMINIYPNPANRNECINVSIRSDHILGIDISVYNYFGNKVVATFSDKFYPGISRIRLDTSGLNSGVYFIVVNIDNKLRNIHKIVLLE